MSFLSGQAVVGQGGVRYGDLQRSDVKSCHIVLSASLVLVVDYVFSHVVVRTRILDLSLSSPVVDNEDEHKNCEKIEFEALFFNANFQRTYTDTSIKVEKQNKMCKKLQQHACLQMCKNRNNKKVT